MQQQPATPTRHSSILFMNDKHTEGSETRDQSLLDNPPLLALYPHYSVHDMACSEHSENSMRKMHNKGAGMHARHRSAVSFQPAEAERANYEEIESILKNENFNLKQQNDLLLREIYRLKSSNKKHK